MTATPAPASSLTTLALGDRTVHLLGTAHISAESCAEVEAAVRDLKPDAVLVELDEGRLKSLRDPDTWKRTDVRQVIRQGQLPALIANLVLGSYQRRLGGQTGVRPGSELLRAVETAEAAGIPVTLCDRPIRKTLRRIWAGMGWWGRMQLLGALVGSLFSRQSVSEAELSALKQRDSLHLMVSEMGGAMPGLARTLISERDWYMAEGIQASAGRTVLAVVGAAHVPGMVEALNAGRRSSLAELEAEPKPSFITRAAVWAVPLLILGALATLVALRWKGGLPDIMQALWLWVACTSIPATVAGVIARAHPLVLLLIAVAAPVAQILRIIPGPKLSLASSLLQAWLRPPTVADMERVADDIATWRGWWTNLLLRVFLVFILPGLAATAGAVYALAVIARGT